MMITSVLLLLAGALGIAAASKGKVAPTPLRYYYTLRYRSRAVAEE